MIKITIHYVLDGIKRSGKCLISSLTDISEIATDLELVAEGAVFVTIGAKGAKCKDCGSILWSDLTPINTVPEYVCSNCYEKHDRKVMQ